MQHSPGQAKLRIIQRIVLMFAMSLAGFAMLGWLAQRFYTGLGVQPNMAGPNDGLALLLFLLALPVFSFFVVPIFAQMSRQHEFEADAYAVAQTSGQDLATALLKLYQGNASTLTPDPLYVAFYYSHPGRMMGLPGFECKVGFWSGRGGSSGWWWLYLTLFWLSLPPGLLTRCGSTHCIGPAVPSGGPIF